MSRLSSGNARFLNYAHTSFSASEELYEGNESFNINDKQEASYFQIDHDEEGVSEGLNESSTCPYGCCKKTELKDHVFGRGLLEGKYSDVTIKAFETEYKLHRLFLDKSTYFRSLFGWNEDEDEDGNTNAFYSVTFDDHYITKESFELALSRLYGAPNLQMELKILHSMIAVSSYLDIDDVICVNTEKIIQVMNMSNVCKYLRFATTNHYGVASERILESAKGILCSSGWEAGAALWDDISEEVIADVVGEDCFFVPNEWDRCMFIIKLIERRTTRNDYAEVSDDSSLHSVTSTIYDTPVNVLRRVLREKVYFCHLSAEQLQRLSDFNDINGMPYIDPSVLHEALWQSTSLQRAIVKSLDVPNLGLAISSDNEEVGIRKNWYRVPVRDETIFGSPSELKKLMSEHQYAPANFDNLSSVNEGEFKTSGELESSNLESRIYSWTKLPPFRFSIAFANASDLSTEKRVYAKTLWYAGSYWNLYLQKVKVKQKKGFQMGVYLHRASTPSSSSRNGLANPDVFVDNINYTDPPIQYSDQAAAETSVGSVDQHSSLLRPGNEEKEIVDDDTLLSYLESMDLSDASHRENNTGTTKLAVHSSVNESIFSPTVHPNFNTSQTNNQRSFLCYDDTRSKISVYFVISTPSRRSKATITSFVSAPDTFNKSQSWGWKSNSMCVFNEDGTFPKDHEKHLKFMVVLGNI